MDSSTSIFIARERATALASLYRNEREAAAEFLVALAEFDGKRLWAELGHSGLFMFLHRELGMSKGAAFYRKVGSELIRSYPEVLPALRDGRLCITTLPDLAKALTPENRQEVLPRFFHCSRREAQEISAALAPNGAPPRRDVVTAAARSAPWSFAVAALPVHESAGDEIEGTGAGTAVTRMSAPSTPTGDTTPSSSSADDVSAPDERGGTAEEPAALDTAVKVIYPRGSHHADIVALTADLRRLHVTVSRRFVQKLDAARVVLSHSHPSGRVADILEAALDLLLSQDARKKTVVKHRRMAKRIVHRRGTARAARSLTSHDAAPSTKKRSQAQGDVLPKRGRPGIPADVRRAVWERDHGCCQYPLDSGGVCGERIRLQIDHIEPVARGGASTIENLRLVCQPHNLHAARRTFGKAFMDQFTRRRGGRAPPG